MICHESGCAAVGITVAGRADAWSNEAHRAVTWFLMLQTMAATRSYLRKRFVKHSRDGRPLRLLPFSACTIKHCEIDFRTC
ncbi:hypothetical protein GV67_10770 [Pseudorhizobium pelagicum]|uniref:Uncharacterized protein n=1 Tax=Pseudorhizobium pelagicum TaxID=1509405 RepID=A0A922NX94_9HYPH|nr:hypothetical protein GV68_20410 [Pseudorhizobium pelagicum]KEQ04168.1 hypothetical protein GV67_10770 [Pseudorhizobium pelagicum]